MRERRTSIGIPRTQSYTVQHMYFQAHVYKIGVYFYYL